MARSHREAIRSRGFTDVEQLFYRTSSVRRVYRSLTGKQYEGWRTYWRADYRGQQVFAKVYFGHDDPRTNLVNGRKQVELTVFFRDRLDHQPGIRFPDLLDCWEDDGFFVVTSAWRRIEPVSMEQLFDATLHDGDTMELIWGVSSLSRPDWWSAEYETHNFALTDQNVLDQDQATAFDIDFLSNLCVDSDRRLYFHDFEKFQWAEKGLLEVFITLQYLVASLRKSSVAARKVADMFSGRQDFVISAIHGLNRLRSCC